MSLRAHAPVPMPLPPFLPERRTRDEIQEPARKVPVIAECDVAVLGGGPAGAVAAVAAARSGARALVVERHAYFGGMATAANVNVWHQFWSLDLQTKVLGGLPEEVIDRLRARGGAENTREHGKANWIIDTEQAKLVYDDMVVGSGAKILFHGWLADVVRGEDGRIEAAIVESKSGRGAIRARTFVDATGDADLCARAGAATHTGDRDGKCQPPTLCFRVGGIDWDRAREADVNTRTIQVELFRHTMDYNGGTYPTFLWGAHSLWRKDEWMFAGTRVPGTNCSDAWDFTRAEVEARYQMRWVLQHMKKFPGFEKSFLVDIGAQIGVRESRRIRGEYEIQERELLEGVRFEDTIAQGVYPVDIHNPDGPGITFRHLDGREVVLGGDGQRKETRWDGQSVGSPPRTTPCYHVPYRALLPRDLSNVLVAGRCVAASHEAAGALRVMVNAMSFGHAAGAAAAQAALRHDGHVRRVDVAGLRTQLKKEGVPLLEVESCTTQAPRSTVAMAG